MALKTTRHRTALACERRALHTVNKMDHCTELHPDDIGEQICQLIAELYPICRSITGDGFRRSLDIVGRHVPLQVHEVPTGKQVFDWTVPREWNIRDAYIKDSTGRRVLDFRESNLHVLGYSMPVKAKVTLEELKGHLFTSPEYPDWIPFRTSYYEENWGFCLSHRQFLELEEGEYEVCIDSSLEDGHLTYGEYYLPGSSTDEVLISCHACHPSLCNDNLSAVALTTFLARCLTPLSLRYSYRFLFIPATIGAITWLCLNEDHLSRIKHGLVLACLGDSGHPTYKKSRRGDAEIDRAVIYVLKHSDGSYAVQDFAPYGYDERQYCSPGLNLPVGCLMRTPYGEFPEYHTSADNLDLMQPAKLGDSFSKCLAVLTILENNKKYVSHNPKCEPQLGKRGLYRPLGAGTQTVDQLALLWVLNLSDGQHTVLDIAERSDMPFETIKEAADALVEHGLLKECL
jgi:aminopeptidase-like protein